MNGKSIIGIVVGIAAYVAVKFLFSHFNSSPKPPEVPDDIKNNPAFQEVMGEIEKVESEFKNVDSVEDALKLTEDAISKTLPLEVDEFTTLVGAKAGPGKLFTYDYQLRGEEVENISPDELEAAMRPTLEAQYKSDMMRAFREGKVTALYRYSDSKGNLITEIKIEP